MREDLDPELLYEHRPAGRRSLSIRVQELTGLTAGNLLTHLRKLADAGYIARQKTGNGVAWRTTVELTGHGRAALEMYTGNLRTLIADL